MVAGRIAGIAAALALIAYVGFVGGAVDFVFGPERPAHPIDYRAVVCQSDADEVPKCRFYVGTP